jgi:hypothetical protein
VLQVLTFSIIIANAKFEEINSVPQILLLVQELKHLHFLTLSIDKNTLSADATESYAAKSQ